MKALLDLATTYGFDKNLWHNYLTFVLVTNENSFSMTSEKVGANNGTVNHFAKNDFQVFMNLFHYDFRPIEETLGIDCFSTILDYKAIGKTERMYNKNVSEKVRALSDELAAAEDVDTFFNAVVKFYKDYGVGMFGLNKAFRIVENNGKPGFVPINNLDKVVLDDLTGYEMLQSQLLYPGEKPAAGCRSRRTEYRSGSPRRRTGKVSVTFPRKKNFVTDCGRNLICRIISAW
mgnify:CR=1 FL=1